MFINTKKLPSWATEPAEMLMNRSKWSAVLDSQRTYGAIPTETLVASETTDLGVYLPEGGYGGIDVYTSDLLHMIFRHIQINRITPKCRRGGAVALARTTFMLDKDRQTASYKVVRTSVPKVDIDLLRDLALDFGAEVKIVEKDATPVPLSPASRQEFYRAIGFYGAEAAAPFDEVHRVQRFRNLLEQYGTVTHPQEQVVALQPTAIASLPLAV